MHKHYSIDELEKTNFWHRLEPEGVDFHYVYNKERKYVYFTPNSQTQFVDYVEKYSELAKRGAWPPSRPPATTSPRSPRVWRAAR